MGHDHHRRQRVEVEDQDGQCHEQKDAQCLRDAIHSLAVHALENLLAFLDGIDDDGQPRRRQNDRRLNRMNWLASCNGCAAVPGIVRR